MERGQKYIVHVHLDEESNRIMASAKIERFLTDEIPPYQNGDEVELLIWQQTELGFKVIIDNAFEGLVYAEQIFKPIRMGDRMKGYIYNVREDGKIDVTLQPTGHQHSLDFAETLLQYLQTHGGQCELGDKSDAEIIKQRFQVSKKVYKRAIGDLYKRRLITIEEDGIKLI